MTQRNRDMPPPPHDAVVEQKLIGAALLDATVIDRVGIRSDDFWVPRHETMWRRIAELNGDRADREQGLLELLRSSGEFRRGILDGPYIHTCIAACPTPAAAEQYARVVIAAAQRRRAHQALERARQRIDSTDTDDVLGALYEAMGDLEEALDTDYAPASHVDKRVIDELRQLRTRHQARALFNAERAGEMPPFDAGTLREMLDRPAAPPERIIGLLPSGGAMLCVAMRKTGKTTLLLNLGHALTTGGNFLGRFAVRPISGNVGILNFEMPGAMLSTWAERIGISPDRLYVVNLRGRRNPFRYPDDKQRLADQLQAHHVEALLVDPFGRAYTGKSQNDPQEVGEFLSMLGEFGAGVGATEIVLSAHAGWLGEHARGSSALEDWADVVAILTTDADDRSARYFSAFGRIDEDVPEDRLTYEPATHILTLAGTGSRKSSKREHAIEAAMPKVLDYVEQHPDSSGNQIRDNVEGGVGVVDKARRRLVESGELIENAGTGRGGGKRYAIATTTTTTEIRPVAVGTTTTTSSMDVVPTDVLPNESTSRSSHDEGNAT